MSKVMLCLFGGDMVNILDVLVLSFLDDWRMFRLFLFRLRVLLLMLLM